MLGVSYLMVFSPESKQMAATQSGLQLVATVPDLDGAPPNGWNIYKVVYPGDESPLVTGLNVEPVVASVHAGNYQQCWGQPWTDTSSQMPKLEAWECAAAPWFMNAAELDKVWTATGPKSWKHIDIKNLGTTNQKSIVPTQVSGIHEDPSTISFHVSDIGKPVLVRTSYFPNWKVHGATGPYRVAPNMMVVVPTSHDVKLTYGLTAVDWLGRLGTIFGIVGLIGLAAWKGLEQYGAMTERPDDENDETVPDPGGGGPFDGPGGGPDGGDDSGPAPDPGPGGDDAGPERSEPVYS
jgi:hypothetical protein